jgi:hypothetical protein
MKTIALAVSMQSPVETNRAQPLMTKQSYTSRIRCDGVSAQGVTHHASLIAAVLLVCLTAGGQQQLFIEAESFSDCGGWAVDQQFVDLMGSPYLLAHGNGKPVSDARTTVQFPAVGNYRLWVRTKDWTAPLSYHPGSFKVVLNGAQLPATFGTASQGWVWQDGGTVQVTNLSTEIRLRDLTGFEGRCDALFFTMDTAYVPTNSLPHLEVWRRQQLGLPAVPPSAGDFDLVVVGGGIAGSAAAIAAARQGLQVALIHDRPFPGGNASQDVRIHTIGLAAGSITPEINTPENYAVGSPLFLQTDQRRMQVLQAETNLHLFCEWRAFRANTNGARILSVDARNNRTGEERRFAAPVFIDCTGDGWLGYWAGALYRMGREGQAEFNESLAPASPDSMTMGSTLIWTSTNTGHAVAFPSVPWATNVAKGFFATTGDWWWEYGLTRNTIYDAEEIRDHLLQAIYGTFSNVKRYSTNANLDFAWVGYIAGKRESRRLVGDYLLTEADVRNYRGFPDAVVTESRKIDIHYPKAGIYDWQTYAQYTSISTYWIPFRCFYSTNIENLMMAGRCLSASHVGLGSPRIMNTGGQMGVTAGTAAALCKQYSITPRGVYQNHIPELQARMGLAPWLDMPTNLVTLVDNSDPNGVQIIGSWTTSVSASGYYGANYIHDGNTAKGTKSVRFTPNLPWRGDYNVFLRWTQGSNRATNTPVDIIGLGGTNTVYVNQQNNGGLWMALGTYPFALGNGGGVMVRNGGTSAYVIADAVVFAAAFALDPNFTGDPWQDDDGDGICNYVEYLNGTDPDDPNSFLKVQLSVQNGAATLGFIATAGRSYTIQYRDSSAPGPWLKLIDVAATNLTREVAIPDSAPSARPSRFYRLVTPQVP